MKFVAGQQKIVLPADTSISADVGIGQIPQGFGIQVALHVKIPGMDKAAAMKIVEAAHQVCPYSNATRGNIEVALDIV
jgi:osmotically inducible protein OsmC